MLTLTFYTAVVHFGIMTPDVLFKRNDDSHICIPKYIQPCDGISDQDSVDFYEFCS